MEAAVKSGTAEFKVDNEGNEKTEEEESQLTKLLAMVLIQTEFIYQKGRQESQKDNQNNNVIK